MAGQRNYRPRIYRDFRRVHPDIAAAYDHLGDACRNAGPLDARGQRLVKIGLAVGLSSEGAVRSHMRRGLDEGLTRVSAPRADLAGGCRPPRSRGSRQAHDVEASGSARMRVASGR